jgi:MerR family transcriptional regulator, light-induced transcriptional regulator
MSALSIGDVVARTGVSEGTLRMWERRYGFPSPERTASGHRRYDEEQVRRIHEVLTARRTGLSLGAAIERAQREDEAGEGSIFAGLRQRYPELSPLLLPKRAMLALSRAVEDEVLARAVRGVLFASFQRERFYRQAEPRWRELAQGAAVAIVFADFEYLRESSRPIEVPSPGDALAREWAIVCDADGCAACLVGREPPSSSVDERSARRRFEAVWSVEPRIVRDAARICAALAARGIGSLPREVATRIEAYAAAPADTQLRLAAAIANRALFHMA